MKTVAHTQTKTCHVGLYKAHTYKQAYFLSSMVDMIAISLIMVSWYVFYVNSAGTTLLLAGTPPIDSITARCT